MEIGLGLYMKYRRTVSYFILIRFWSRKSLLGFDSANQLIQRLDKYSVQLILRRYGAKIGKNCDIETGLVFHNCKNYKNLIIGDNCHIGKNCFFDLKDKIIIGDNVVVSMQCTFITHIHTGNSGLSNSYPPNSAPIVINDKCYLGARVTILKNTNLSNNAFIAAGAIVTKNVPENTMVGGVPARPIKSFK